MTLLFALFRKLPLFVWKASEQLLSLWSSLLHIHSPSPVGTLTLGSLAITVKAGLSAADAHKQWLYHVPSGIMRKKVQEEYLCGVTYYCVCHTQRFSFFLLCPLVIVMIKADICRILMVSLAGRQCGQNTNNFPATSGKASPSLTAYFTTPLTYSKVCWEGHRT